MTVKKHLINEVRLQILEDYLGSDQSKKAIASKYGITPGSLSDWLRIFGLKDKEITGQILGILLVYFN